MSHLLHSAQEVMAGPYLALKPLRKIAGARLLAIHHARVHSQTSD